VKELDDMTECCIYYATSANSGSEFVQYADAHTREIYLPIIPIDDSNSTEVL